jgi:Protein of unknown function (DUF3800)
MWKFYLDESGHGGKITPHIVVGGFGIKEEYEADFESAILAHYTFCFGFALDFTDERKEIKGARFLKLKIFKWLGKYPNYPPIERYERVDNFFARGENASPPNGEDHAAYAQACLMFVKGLGKILQNHHAQIITALTSEEHYKDVAFQRGHFENEPILKNGKLFDKTKENVISNFHTYLISDLEMSIYRHFAMHSTLQDEKAMHVEYDYTESKANALKSQHFLNCIAKFKQPRFRHLQSPLLIKNSTKRSENKDAQLNALNFTIEFPKSHQSIFIQIADLICYIFNWGFATSANNNLHSKLRPEINEILRDYCCRVEIHEAFGHHPREYYLTNPIYAIWFEMNLNRYSDKIEKL